MDNGNCGIDVDDSIKKALEDADIVINGTSILGETASQNVFTVDPRNKLVWAAAMMAIQKASEPKGE